MDTSILLFGVAGLALGLLLGWLLELRIDAAHWHRQIAQITRHELLRRSEVEKEVNEAQQAAERRCTELRHQYEVQLVEMRARAFEQIAAAHARAETVLDRSKPVTDVKMPAAARTTITQKAGSNGST